MYLKEPAYFETAKEPSNTGKHYEPEPRKTPEPVRTPEPIKEAEVQFPIPTDSFPLPVPPIIPEKTKQMKENQTLGNFRIIAAY